jgi:hypothetical protein
MKLDTGNRRPTLSAAKECIRFWSKGAALRSASEWLRGTRSPLGLSGLASYRP